VAGRRMWEKKGDVDILTSIMKGEVPSLAEAVPDAPAALLRVVANATRRDRDQRYASAAGLQEEIEAYLKSTGDVPTMRDVARVASEVFATERTTLKGTIDKHLAAIQAGHQERKLPSLRPPRPSENTPIRSQGPQSESSLTPLGQTPPGTAMPSSTPV